ncbi:hypothetical protein ABIB25_002512 [Nakamurella sp. UYEF19]
MIVQLLVSSIHRYEGRPSDGPLPEPPGELVDSVRVRAGLGIVGDRFRAMRGRGGVRCVPLNDGVLRIGPVTAVVA